MTTSRFVHVSAERLVDLGGRLQIVSSPVAVLSVEAADPIQACALAEHAADGIRAALDPANARPDGDPFRGEVVSVVVGGARESAGPEFVERRVERQEPVVAEGNEPRFQSPDYEFAARALGL